MFIYLGLGSDRQLSYTYISPFVCFMPTIPLDFPVMAILTYQYLPMSNTLDPLIEVLVLTL